MNKLKNENLIEYMKEAWLLNIWEAVKQNCVFLAHL